MSSDFAPTLAKSSSTIYVRLDVRPLVPGKLRKAKLTIRLEDMKVEPMFVGFPSMIVSTGMFAAGSANI
jgi:hypothetical protein